MQNVLWNKTRKPRFSFRHLSLRQELPLLIMLLLCSVIFLFGWSSYLAIRRAALDTGRGRLQNLSGQLVSLFQQSAAVLVSATQSAANDPSLAACLQTAGTHDCEQAVAALQKLKTDTLNVLFDLRDLQGKSVFRSGRKTACSAIPLDSLHPGTVGKFFVLEDSLYYPILATIHQDGHPVGTLVRWRSLVATRKAIEQLSQLMGSNATLYFANDDQTVWTDMMHPVPGPPVGKKILASTLSYQRGNRNPVLAALNPVPGTHWLILVELSEQTMLEAAHRYLYWVLLIGGALSALGGLLAWLISRSITRPLDELILAADRVTRGDYTSPVVVRRQDELGRLATAFKTMAGRVGESQLQLEQQVNRRTAELQASNQELEAFSYSVSHDLRAPLRAVSGYGVMLKEDYGPQLDQEANRIIGHILENARMMGQLIDDLIAFARWGKKDMQFHPVRMKELAENCLAELCRQVPQVSPRIRVDALPDCLGDTQMIKQVWINLLSNAIKYSSKNPAPQIEVSFSQGPSGIIYEVRDNGVGFDMLYADKLFGVFQRLHSQQEFEGTGVGLALVKRIVQKHQGQIWAESKPGEGAVFYFSLPHHQVN